VASYQYTLGTSGNRTGVTELSGRTVAYGYDNLYRLTSETIANDLSGMNGAMSYLYDTVGNRRQISSTLAAIAPGNWNYDANDRLTNDQNDADGNIVARAGIANAYDFENHLIQHGYMTFVYDGDGNRVAKTVGGVTTTYLVDTLNPTGYAQVLDELQSNTVARSYTWGLQLVSESQLVAATPPANPWQTSWYGLDGHGSVRYLTNSTGAVTDTYDYDAFGNLINSTGSTANNYLFAGEQFDPNLGLYYNRARYLDVQLGRFWGMDSFEGRSEDPSSLHKYQYASGNPVSHVDPSGHDDLVEMVASAAMVTTLTAAVVLPILQHGLVNSNSPNTPVHVAIYLDDRMPASYQAQAMGDFATAQYKLKNLKLDLELVSSSTVDYYKFLSNGGGQMGVLNIMYASGADMIYDSGSMVLPNGKTAIFVNMDQITDRITEFEVLQALSLNVSQKTVQDLSNVFGIVNWAKDQAVIYPLVNAADGGPIAMYLAQAMSFGTYQAILENAKSF
jgi:RHS repeat-associated protein